MSLLRFFHPVIASKKLGKKPLAIQIGDEAIVLFRNQKGDIAVLKDRCPHRFTPLSAGKVDRDGMITCPYHGWRFDEKGEGQKPGDDGKCRVHSYQVVERYKFIWVAEHGVDPALIPTFDNDGWAFFDSYSFSFEAPFHVVIDNFSEDEHFPFVHTMLGWDETGVRDVEHSCERVGNQVHVNYWGPQRSFFGMSLMLAKPGQFFENKWIQEYDPVRFTYTARLTDKQKNLVSPGYSRATIYFVPSGPNETQLHVFQSGKFMKPFWYKLIPFIRPTYVGLVKRDLRNDADLARLLKKVPYGLKGMALSKYDEPLKHNRELLEKVYFGKSPSAD